MFNSGKIKSENEQLKQTIQNLEAMLTPEMRSAQKLQEKINELEDRVSSINTEIDKRNSVLTQVNIELNAIDQTIAEKKKQIIELDDNILLQDFGMYTPVYNLMNSQAYKDKLLVTRQKEKDLIKGNRACRFPTNFLMNGSAAQGKKLVSDNVKQIIRAFNNECDSIIDKVKFNNIEAFRKKIEKSYNDLNKMNAKMSISLVPEFLDLKLKELNLCYEYEVKKQEEKEEQKEIRERLREEVKLQKEIEEERKKVQKEQSHYQNALSQIEDQLKSDPENEELLKKKAEIEGTLTDIDTSLKDMDYREANKRAGYVYVISNIGSFGENVYKIGMTRRLDPTERVDELGDASVPFNFDIHAMIFSDDAPALETALHQAFENRKVNMVNQRREFFNVTLDEIENEVKKNFDKTVEFIRMAPAEQYRESVALKKNA